MISAVAALAAFSLLCINKKCRDAAKPFALFTAVSILMIAPEMWYYAAMATCDLFIVLCLSNLNQTLQIRSVLYLSLCSVLANIYGFILYYSYMPPHNYNFLMQCIIIMQVLCIWMMRDGFRLDFIHIIFRTSRSNSDQ